MERHGERPRHAEIEDLHPLIAGIVRSDGQLQVACKGGWRCAERERTPVDPNVVVEQQDAVVGQRAFDRSGQIGGIGYVEHDAGGGRVEMERGGGGAGHRGVLPAGEAHRR